MSIQTNIQEVRQRIAAACGECGRDPKEITLVGASKMNDAAACREAIAAGIDVLGENRGLSPCWKPLKKRRKSRTSFRTFFWR